MDLLVSTSSYHWILVWMDKCLTNLKYSKIDLIARCSQSAKGQFTYFKLISKYNKTNCFRNSSNLWIWYNFEQNI